MSLGLILRYRMSLMLLVILLLCDLLFRLWQPVMVSSQSNPLEAPAQLPAAREVPLTLLEFYQLVAQPAQLETTVAEQIPVDAKQIGDYIVELFAIYSQGGQYKAILRVQPDPDAGKRLRRVGLGPLNETLTLKTLSADSLTVESASQSVTLQLFNKKQPKKAAE